MAGVSRPRKSFTPKQGQYLAFIPALGHDVPWAKA
jgi:hypothetical protein